MATEYAVPAFHRGYPTWDDVYYTGSFRTYTSAFVTTNVSATTKNNLDADVYSGVPMEISADGGFYIFFGAPYVLNAYLLDLVSGSAPEVFVTTDVTPDVSTGGWTSLGTASLTPVSGYRTPSEVTPHPYGITGLRFQFTGPASVGNFHIYGSPVSQPSVKLVRVDGTTPMAPGDWNFGTGGKDGSKDIQFRIHNTAPKDLYVFFDWVLLTDTASGPSLLDEIFISVDGVSFKALSDPSGAELVGGASIPVGGLSPVITLRRISYVTHDNSRPYSLPFVIFPEGVIPDDLSVRLYVGDVDPTKSQIQLWSSSPAHVVPGDVLTLTTAGAGDTESEFFTSIYIVVPGSPPMVLTPTSWVQVAANPALGGNSSKVDRIDHASRIFEPPHQEITVSVPSTIQPGSYGIQIWSTVGNTGYVSNLTALAVDERPEDIPAPQDGFRLQATSLSGSILASNVPFKRLAFTDELSDVGAGRVDLNFESAFWTETPTPALTPDYIADNEFIWQVWEGKSLRFSFLNSIAEDTQIHPKLTRLQEGQAEGIGSALGWSMVVPPRFPVVPPYYWSFAHARLWQWLTIWAECVLRASPTSIQHRFIPTFTRYTDSVGNAWLDPGYENQQRNGVDMLTLLKEHCDSVGADFHVEPDFRVNVIYSRSTIDVPGKYFGTDRTQVIFRSSLLTEKRVLRDRSEVGNWIIAQDDYGEVTLKFDQGSIIRNGMRERFVEAGRSGLVTTRSSRAEEELKWHRDQIVSWTLAVQPYYEASDGTIFNRVFVDYKVGDWIYLETGSTSAVDSVQVSAITVVIGEDGATEVELTLESLAALRKRKAELRDSITSGGGSGSGGSSLILFEEEIFPVASETPGVTYEIKYLPLPKSEIITLGMKKFMEVNGGGELAVREFTRTLRRGEHWERVGWEVTITDPTVFDEAF